MNPRKRAATIARLSGVMLAVAAATAAVGQGAAPPAPAEQQQPGGSAGGLDLPDNVKIFGKLDPNIRKATALVNGAVITGTDVDQRMALIISANPGIPLSEQDRERLRLQVLRQLIDETLQIQEAKARDISITNDEISQSVDRIARNFKQTPAAFRKFLTDQGSSERSLRRQVEAELAWNRYLRRRVEPFVNVGDEEVKAIMDRLKAAQGTEEYNLREIYLSASADRQQQVIAQGREIMQKIQKGEAPFEYFARNFSEASTRAVGGDLGWVRGAQLPDVLSQAAQEMQVGQIAGPVEVPGGYSILFMADKRRVLTADPRDSKLSLKQMTIKFPAGTTEAQAAQRTADFAKVTQSLKGCGSVEQVAGGINAEVVQNDAVLVRDLPPQLQSILVQMQVGQATPPFGSPTEGVRTLVLCGREDAQSGSLPGAGQIQQQLEQQRVNLRAQQTLRDLRRDAVIEYR